MRRTLTNTTPITRSCRRSTHGAMRAASKLAGKSRRISYTRRTQIPNGYRSRRCAAGSRPIARIWDDMTAPRIPYGRQDIRAEDIEAVATVLRSDWLTQGPTVPRFEAALAKLCSAGHAIVVNSATSALHIACAALGLGPGDRLWTSPNTFTASANCGLYCGAQV